MSDLLPLVAQGDQAAARQCLERYGPLVWAIARRFFQDPLDAEDAMQEAFVSVWTHAHRFDSSRAKESTFVTMVARRRFIDAKRHKNRRPVLEPLGDREPSHPGPSDGEADRARIIEALEQLRPEVRRVLLLSVSQGLTHSEIAAATGLPLGTVKSHARRGLVQLRQLLESPQVQAPELGEVNS